MICLSGYPSPSTKRTRVLPATQASITASKFQNFDEMRSAGVEKDVETYSHTLKHFFDEARADRKILNLLPP